MSSNSITLKKLPKSLHGWLMAVRLRTMPIPTIQVFTGTALAYALTKNIDWILFLYTWLVAIFITIGTNLINDAIDFEKGSDSLKRFGHVKVIRTGLLTKKQVSIGGFFCLALAIVCAIPLGIYASWGIFLLVVLSAFLGYSYTGGPFPICYLGLSELFIFIFYGCVCVMSSFFVQTGFMSYESLLAAIQMGLLAILPNALNNLRDIFEDAEVNKRTLAVRFGKRFARWEIAVITMLPFVLNILWIFWGYPEAGLLPILFIPIAFLFVRSVWKTDPGPLFNRYFMLSVFVHFAFGILLIAGIFLS